MISIVYIFKNIIIYKKNIRFKVLEQSQLKTVIKKLSKPVVVLKTMTYSLDFRKQVLKSLDYGMTFAGEAEFYNLSLTTIQNWKRRVHSKTTRKTKPYKIPDDVLLNDVKEYPDDYHYEPARRLNCSKIGNYHALKRLESMSDQKSGVLE